ncbi:hypothetical protein Ccrd_026423 [Cynara cardunculus var. scolymus]|uniref:Uncharacterized protein n=1 Tax=Cynara cardunculus var. scolymus TaxID=59895 RepID=A0A124R3H2_CYNCS|nr:hypothetical protein Ccrd_026423 [Cynara cardunculus var. scolymus]
MLLQNRFLAPFLKDLTIKPTTSASFLLSEDLDVGHDTTIKINCEHFRSLVVFFVGNQRLSDCASYGLITTRLEEISLARFSQRLDSKVWFQLRVGYHFVVAPITILDVELALLGAPIFFIDAS